MFNRIGSEGSKFTKGSARLRRSLIACAPLDILNANRLPNKKTDLLAPKPRVLTLKRSSENTSPVT